MANQRIPNDPDRSQSDPYRSPLAGDDIRDPSRLDNELQPDPELAEGPAGGGRIAAFAVAIAVVLGAIFYGLNNSSIDHAGTSSTAQNTAQPQNTAPPQSTAQNQPSPKAAPPGIRDVTPHANTSPGVTTGAAPTRPQNPPSSGPTGQDVNRSGNAPANNAPANK
jgi:hypothetical protein